MDILVAVSRKRLMADAFIIVTRTSARNCTKAKGHRMGHVDFVAATMPP
jgi:hypothetical protein